MLDLVSVVIPTYNRCEELKKSLGSVLSQTYKNFEVVVIDNNSTDGTDYMLESFNDQRIRLLKINNNGVIAASRNLGIKVSKGKWIAFLDSDDWWHPNKLEKVMRYCNSDYDVCYHDLRVVSDYREFDLYRKKFPGRQVKAPVFNDLIQLGNALSNSSVVVRAILIKKIGGLCEDRRLIGSEDYECWIRLSKLTNKFKYIPETLGCYWIGATNTTNASLSLVNLQYIYKLYIAKFNEENNLETPTWWVYAYARALYLTGDVLRARNLLKELTKRDISLIVRLKSYYMMLVSK